MAEDRYVLLHVLKVVITSHGARNDMIEGGQGLRWRWARLGDAGEWPSSEASDSLLRWDL
jgi:hypothetical protein